MNGVQRVASYPRGLASLVFLLLVLVAFGVVFLGCNAGSATGANGTSSGVESYESIGAQVGLGYEIKQATFTPNISRETAEMIAREGVKSRWVESVYEHMTVESTVALLSRTDAAAGSNGVSMKVWLVVVRGLEKAHTSGPALSTTKMIDPQLNLVIADADGAVIYESWSGTEVPK